MTKELFLCFFAVSTAIISLVLKSFAPQFSSLLQIAATIFFILFFFQYISPVIIFINSITEKSEYADYFKILLKGTGISVLICTVCEICRDLGESSIAEKAEICGKAILIYISLPIIEKIFGYINEFLRMQ